MGIKARDWARSIRGLTKSQNLVLRELAECCADDTDVVWPTTAELSERLEIPQRTIRYCIDVLERVGLIKVLNKGNQYKPTHYRLSLDMMHVRVNRQKPASEVAKNDTSKSEAAKTRKVKRQKRASEVTKTRTAYKEEPKETESLTESIYGEALSVLSEIPNFQYDTDEERKLLNRLTKHSISPELALQTANDMKAKIWYERGKWWYHGQKGKTSYTHLYVTLGNWVIKPNRAPPSSNGRNPPEDAYDEMERRLKNRPTIQDFLREQENAKAEDT